MNYLCLLYRDEAAWSLMDEADREAYLQAMERFSRAMAESGHIKDCQALESAWTATTLRSRDGKCLIVDGPFAETKEQLVGYYVIDVAHLDEAIEVVKNSPSVQAVATEIRPILNGAPPLHTVVVSP